MKVTRHVVPLVFYKTPVFFLTGVYPACCAELAKLLPPAVPLLDDGTIADEGSYYQIIDWRYCPYCEEKIRYDRENFWETDRYYRQVDEAHAAHKKAVEELDTQVPALLQVNGLVTCPECGYSGQAFAVNYTHVVIIGRSCPACYETALNKAGLCAEFQWPEDNASA